MRDTLPKSRQRLSGAAVKLEPKELPSAMDFEDLMGASVGTWQWDIAHDLVHYCTVTARLFDMSDQQGHEGVPLRFFQERIHPDDLPHLNRLLENSCREGGLFVAEYRTVPRPHDVRWVLSRGSFELDETGTALRGRGITIDITGAKRASPPDDRGLFVSRSPRYAPPIDIVADRVLDGLELARKLEPGGFARLKPLFEKLLFEVGRQIASGLAEEGAPPSLSKSDLH